MQGYKITVYLILFQSDSVSYTSNDNDDLDPTSGPKPFPHAALSSVAPQT